MSILFFFFGIWFCFVYLISVGKVCWNSICVIRSFQNIADAHQQHRLTAVVLTDWLTECRLVIIIMYIYIEQGKMNERIKMSHWFTFLRQYNVHNLLNNLQFSVSWTVFHNIFNIVIMLFWKHQSVMLDIPVLIFGFHVTI